MCWRGAGAALRSRRPSALRGTLGPWPYSGPAGRSFQLLRLHPSVSPFVRLVLASAAHDPTCPSDSTPFRLRSQFGAADRAWALSTCATHGWRGTGGWQKKWHSGLANLAADGALPPLGMDFPANEVGNPTRVRAARVVWAAARNAQSHCSQ